MGYEFVPRPLGTDVYLNSVKLAVRVVLPALRDGCCCRVTRSSIRSKVQVHELSFVHHEYRLGLCLCFLFSVDS